MSENLSKDGNVSPIGTPTSKLNFDLVGGKVQTQNQKFKLQLVAEESDSHKESQNSQKNLDLDSILKQSLEPFEQLETNPETASPVKSSQYNMNQKKLLSRTIDSNMDAKYLMDKSENYSDRFQQTKSSSQ